MLNKYTLYAKNGYLLRSDEHYLFIGEWLSYRSGYVILEHGTLTDRELVQLLCQKYVSVYQHTNLHIVSITAPYDEKYFSRQSDHSKLLQYIGSLKRINERTYRGELNVK